MPKIIGKAVRVVDHEGLTIDECAGNVATQQDTISIADVNLASPGAEPWLTLDYDEWICVRRGKIELHSEDGSVLTVQEGETAFVEKGERFKPVFPVANTQYIPVCIPAFRPDRCKREEETESSVSTKLKDLHSNGSTGPRTAGVNTDEVDVLYHMCQKTLWEKAVSSGEAYFPPTFEKDGMFTHATAVAERLLETGNHFYTDVKGDWICLQLSRSALLKVGIKTIFEEAKPVGNIQDNNHWDWICPHIFGGLPTSIPGIVTKIYDIKRDSDGKFISIPGLSQT